MSVINWCFQEPSQRYAHLLYYFELEASERRFEQAIAERGPEILNYVFVDSKVYPAITYTPLDFAVKIGDVDSARSLIDWGSNSLLADRLYLS